MQVQYVNAVGISNGIEWNDWLSVNIAVYNYDKNGNPKNKTSEQFSQES